MAVLGVTGFAEEGELIGNGVIAMTTPGMTAEQTPCGEVQSLQYSMFLYRLDGVLRARGGVAARGRCQRGDEPLVEPDGEYEETAKQGGGILQYFDISRLRDFDITISRYFEIPLIVL